MRIGLLIGWFPPGDQRVAWDHQHHPGGAELQAEQWASRLGRSHEVTVISRRHRPTDAVVEDRNGYQVIRTPIARLPGWRTVADVRSVRSAVASLPKQPDVLLCFQTFVSGFAGVQVQTRTGTPAVVWIRGEDEYRFDRSWRARMISPGVWDRARCVLVQSKANQVALLDALRPVAPAVADRVSAKLDIVPNGIELPESEPTERGKAVLVLGRLKRRKGVDLVIDAMAEHPDTELIVAGDGPERLALESQAVARGVRATFLGVVGRADLGELFGRARCLVMASRFGEGFPNVLLEAMAHRVPVVTTPVGATGDLVTDGVSGLMIGTDDPVAVRRAVARLLNDDELHGRLAATGRDVVSRYAWESVQRRLEHRLERLI
jgi:glycosyltransferase involved in cell wall biosynthesis